MQLFYMGKRNCALHMKSFKTHQAECDHRNHYKTNLLKEFVQKLVNELASPKSMTHPNTMELHLTAHVRQSLSKPFLPVTFKMENIEGKRLLLGSVWQSPSFYTGPFCYKLCLVIYPNGCCNGTNTYTYRYLYI